MIMYLKNIHRCNSLLYLNFKVSIFQSPFSLPFCTNTSISNSPSFAISDLINNFNFSPQSASKICSTNHLVSETPQNPNSVLNIFKNHGFSQTQLPNIIKKAPWLLSCDPSKRVLPKFDFLISKGASISDIVNLVSKNPIVLSTSLEDQIVPAYELVYRFLKSDQNTMALFSNNPSLFSCKLVPHNVRVLIENGVTERNIARLLLMQYSVLYRNDLVKLVDELKDLGFHPSKSTFTIALKAKTSISRTLWNEKLDVFKKWGWSDEDILEAFRRKPQFMLTSIDKINLVMNFWVNHLGWDALAIAKGPCVLLCSLERRIIPRAAVIQYLLKKGLLEMNASLTSPFSISEMVFVDTYIKCFKEDSSYLLKLYEEKLNL